MNFLREAELKEPVERVTGFRIRCASYRSAPPSNPTGSWVKFCYAFGVVTARRYAKRQTPNAKRRTPSAERRASSAERRTPTSMLRLLTRPIFKTRKLFQESKRYIARRAVTLFGDNQICFTGFFLLRIVIGLVIFRANQQPH
jgi:hypothetical protein